MLTKKKGLRMAILVFLVIVFFPKVTYSQVNQRINELRETIQNKDLNEITVFIEKTDSWPKIVASKTIDNLSSEEQKFQREAHKLAKELFGKIREFEVQYGKDDNINSLTAAVEIYSRMGRILKRKQGYVNLVLTETVYRLGLSRLASFLRENPERYQEVDNLWQNFDKPFYDVSNIIVFCEEELGIANAKNKIEKFPESIFYSINKIIPEHFKMKVSEELSVDDPYKMFSTTHLIDEMDIFIFLQRLSGTDTILEISIPGAIEYLNRGGQIEDLPKYWKDVRPFEKIMEGSEKMKANFSGDVGPFVSNLYFLTDEFKSKEENTPNFYIK